MSEESDVFTATNFINGSTEAEFSLFGGGTVDDTFWDVFIIAQGGNTEVEITRVRTVADAGGRRTLFYTVRNNTGNPTSFTRSAVRTPNF